MIPACTANMSSPVTIRQPRRRAASRSAVIAGSVTRSATQAGRFEPRHIDGQRIGRLHAERRRVNDQGVACRIGRSRSQDDKRGLPETSRQGIAPKRVKVGNSQRRHSSLDQRQRDGGARAAGADHERAGAAWLAARPPQRRDHGGPVGHVAAPAAAVDAVQQIDGAETTSAVGGLVAMRQGRELMRDRDHEAVDVLHRLGSAHERVEIARRDMNRNAHRIDLAGGEFTGEPRRRPGLGDRIADDEMKPRLAVEGGEHSA